MAIKIDEILFSQGGWLFDVMRNGSHLTGVHNMCSAVLSFRVKIDPRDK